MNTRAKVRVTGNLPIVDHTHRVLRGHAVEVTTLNAANDATLHHAPLTGLTMARTVLMVVTAPFIGLAYVIALPAIGLYMFAKLAREALAKNHPTSYGRIAKTMTALRNVGLFFAAPFIALAYVIALPAVGFYTITRLALEAHAKHAH